MVRLNRFFLTILSFIFSFECSSFIRSITVLQLDGREIILCAEEHSFGHASNAIHSQVLSGMVRSWATEGVHVAVEDLKSYHGSLGIVSDAITNEQLDSPLDYLASLCEKYLTPFANVEFRFARHAAVAPILSFQSSKLGEDMALLFESSKKGLLGNGYAQACAQYIDEKYPISGSVVVQEFDDVVKDVRSYKDGSFMSAYYRKQLENLKVATPFLKKLGHFNGTVAEYIYGHVDPEKQKAMVHDLFYFDVNLIDVRSIHTLVNASQYLKSIVFLGQFHAFQVSHFLQSLGWVPVVTIGNPVESPYPVCAFDGQMRHALPIDPGIPLTAEELQVLAKHGSLVQEQK